MCYSCEPPFDWKTAKGLEEHCAKTGHLAVGLELR